MANASTTSVYDQLLIADFNQCFQHIRYYEEWFRRLIEFGIGLALAVLAGFSALIARYGRTGLAVTFGALLCGVATVGGLLLLMALARVRVQMALVCRYVNEIRAAYVGNNSVGVANVVGMYTDYTRPRNHDPQSIHTLGIYFVAGLNTLLFVACVGTLPSALLHMEGISARFLNVWVTVFTMVLFLALQLAMVHHYWWRSETGNKIRPAFAGDRTQPEAKASG